MMRSSTLQRLAAVTLGLWVALSPLAADAQNLQQSATSSAQSTTETIVLMVGDIFEVLPTSDIQNPTYSWILTQDRSFIQAGRAPTFRVRLIQPGTYTLIAEIDSPDLSQRITRTFMITAKPRPLGQVQDTATGSSMLASASGTSIVTTDPPINQKNHVVLGDNQQLVKLTPVNPDLKPLSLDVNTAMDSNGDGNPSNDVDNQDTFFQNYASPLYVWFASPITSRNMAVTTVQNGGAVIQTIEVDSLDYARQNGLLVSPVTIVTTKTADRAYAFSPQFTASQAPQSTLLYHWNFGDGQESLLMNPTHTYAQNGTYAVHLQVSDLVNGSQIATADTQIVASGSTGTGAAASTASAASSQAAGAQTGGGLSLGSIVWLVVIFIAFVAIGLLVTFVLSRLRRGRPLDETFAALEKNIVGKEPNEKKTPPPLTIAATVQKPAPTQAEVVKREEERTQPNSAAQTPRIDEAAAPSWLRKGLTGQQATANPKEPTPAPQPQQTQPAPKPTTPPMPVTPKAPEPPAPAQPKPAPKPAPSPTPQQTAQAPTPRPAPASAPQPTATQPSAPLPSWLQPTQGTPPAPQAPSMPPAPKTPAPTPKPATPPTAAPTPSPKPMTSPVQTPAPAAAPMPAPQPAQPAPAAEQPKSQQVIPPPPAAAPKAETPVQQAPAAQPAKPIDTTPTDNTIAVIRADSIEEQTKEPPQANA